MRIINRAIADAYARELLDLGFGYALWQAYSAEKEREAALLGDVGWIEDGQFHPLFNTMSPQDSPLNKLWGIPKGFVPITDKVSKSDGLCSPFSHGVVASVMLDHTLVDRTPMMNPAPDHLATLYYRSLPEAGALLIPKTPVAEQRAAGRPLIVRYIREHFRAWVEFACSPRGLFLSIAEEDLVWVSGTLKASAWSALAFERNPPGRTLALQGKLYAFENDTIAVEVNGEAPPAEWLNAGRSERTREPDGNVQDGPRDQCLFVHYYKMQRRHRWLWWRKTPMEAGAGPHELPRGPGGEGGSSATAAVVGRPSSKKGGEAVDGKGEFIPRREKYDPVRPVLDYIFEHSSATSAIASTFDVYALFDAHGFSQDIRALLDRAAPTVEVDEDGGVYTVPRKYWRRGI